MLLSCPLGKKLGQFWQASAFQLNKLWNMNMHRIPVCRDIFVLETRVVTDSFQFRSGNLWTPINIGTILIGPFDNSSLLPERMRHTAVLWVLKGWGFFNISPSCCGMRGNKSISVSDMFLCVAFVWRKRFLSEDYELMGYHYSWLKKQRQLILVSFITW